MHIIFSGMDGSGKSTQISLLAKYFSYKKTKILWTRGGYTPSFKIIKRFLKFLISLFKKKSKKNSNKKARKDLRSRLFSNKIFVHIWLTVSIIDMGIYLIFYLRYLKLRGYIVINDRCHIDTEIDFLLRFPNQFNTNGLLWRSITLMIPSPDIAFLCIVDPELSIKRSIIKNDIYTDPVEHLADRFSLYKDVSLRPEQEWHNLDCGNSIEDIHQEVKLKINEIYENSTS